MVDRQTDTLVDRQTYTLVDRQTDTLADRQTYTLVDRQTDTLVDRQTDTLVDRQTDTLVDRQTHGQTDKQTQIIRKQKSSCFKQENLEWATRELSWYSLPQTEHLAPCFPSDSNLFSSKQVKQSFEADHVSPRIYIYPCTFSLRK